MTEDTETVMTDGDAYLGPILDGLENLITGQGGQNDSRAHGNRRFGFQRRTYKELEELYRSNWAAAQVVEIPAFEMTRERRTFELEDSGMVETLEDAERSLCLWEKIQDCLKWRAIHGGGALLLGVDGAGELDEPLVPERVGPGALKFIHALDARTIVPMYGLDTTIVYDPTSPHFMQPEFYRIAGSQMPQVHASRLVRFPGISLPWLEMQRSLWWGQSMLERLFDPLADAEQVIGGVADLVTEAKIDVFSLKGLVALMATPDGAERVMKRLAIVQQGKSMYNAVVKDTEEDYEQKQNAVVQGMGPLIEQYLAIVSAASGIPVTRLLGTSAKGLSATGDGDIRNYYDMIDAQRRNYLRARLDELDEVLLQSTLGGRPDGYSWTFGPLWQMDEKEESEIGTNRATQDQAYFNMGVIDEVVIAKRLQAEGAYAAIDAEYIEQLEADIKELEENPPPDPMLPTGQPTPELATGETEETGAPAAE